MGHELPGIESHYVEHVEDDRLIAVSDTVEAGCSALNSPRS